MKRIQGLFLNKKLKNIAGAKSLNLEEIYVYMNAKKSGSIIRTLEDGQNAEERMKWQNIAGNGFKKSLITLWLQQPKFTLLWA